MERVREQKSSLLGKIPWGFLMIVFLLLTHYVKIPMEGVVGYAFIGMGMLVLFVEFFKSGDVSSTAFIIDQLFALVAVIASTALLTYLYFVLNQAPNFFHWFGFAVIMGDAVLSPFNAYRMALRNIGLTGQ